MTEIKYKDTTIPVEAGQTVTLNTADKKLTGDIAITAPKESGGGDTRDVRTVCINFNGGWTHTLSYCTEDAPTTRKWIGTDSYNWVNIVKGRKIRLAVESSYQHYFNNAYCEQLGGEIGTTLDGNVRYTDWFVVNDNIFDFTFDWASSSGGGIN